jgi:TIR domain
VKMQAHRARVFVSYARADLELVTRLVAHLGPLRDDLGLIDLFWDQDLAGGDPWRAVIDRRLEEADLIVLGVSASYFASNYCRAEMERALARQAAGGARVVPVSLQAVDRGATPLSGLNWLPRGPLSVGELEHPDPQLAEVAREIRRLASALVAQPAAPAAAATDGSALPRRPLATARQAPRSYLRTLEVLLMSSLLTLGVAVYRCSSLAGSLSEARSPMINAQLLDLGTERGTSPPIVANSSRPAELLLHVFDDGVYAAYGAIIRDAGGRTRWQATGLRRTNDGFIIGLPQRSVPAGLYEIELFGLKQGRRTSLGVFVFEVRR